MPEPTPAPTPSVDRVTRPSTLLPGATHRTVDVPGGRIHCVEQGTGPLVLLVHGFPESWYSWRHQLPALAAAGHRAVAIDVRGYGRSSAPAATDAYRMLAHVADNTAVVHGLGEETATVVGHDWGSPIAANSALLRPDVFTAVGLLSVPYAPRGGPRPTDGFAGIGGEEEFYVSYFQTPGRAEAEIEPDVRGWLAGFYAGLSGDTHAPADHPGLFFVPPGARMADRFPPRLPRLARRAGPRRLQRGVRTHRPHRRAQPLSQRRPGLGGPRRLGRSTRRPALDLHRRRPGRLHHLDVRRHRRLPEDPPRPVRRPHPRRLRPLDPAGTPRRGQPPADRLAARPALRDARPATPPRQQAVPRVAAVARSRSRTSVKSIFCGLRKRRQPLPMSWAASRSVNASRTSVRIR